MELTAALKQIKTTAALKQTTAAPVLVKVVAVKDYAIQEEDRFQEVDVEVEEVEVQITKE